MKTLFLVLLIIGGGYYLYTQSEGYGRHLAPAGTYYLLSPCRFRGVVGPTEWHPGQELHVDRSGTAPANAVRLTDGVNVMAVATSQLTRDMDEGARLGEAERLRQTAAAEEKERARQASLTCLGNGTFRPSTLDAPATRQGPAVPTVGTKASLNTGTLGNLSLRTGGLPKQSPGTAGAATPSSLSSSSLNSPR